MKTSLRKVFSDLYNDGNESLDLITKRPGLREIKLNGNDLSKNDFLVFESLDENYLAKEDISSLLANDELVRKYDEIRKELTSKKDSLFNEIKPLAGYTSRSKVNIEDLLSESHGLDGKQIYEALKHYKSSDEFLTKQMNLLKSVDGIGDKVAWKLLSEIKFETIENISPKAQVAHAGLSPKEHSSGSSIKARPHISRMGNSDMRKVLFLPALGCIKNPNHFTPFYLRLLDNGKPKKLAVVAVMRKMLLTAAGVLKNQEPFDPNWAHKTQENYMNSLKVA